MENVNDVFYDSGIVLWQTLPVIGVFCLLFFIVQVPLMICGAYRCIIRKNLPDFFYGILKATFRGSVDKKQINGGQEKDCIFGYQVSIGGIYWITIITFTLWQALVTTFWTVFLTEITVSKNIDQTMDCYRIDICNQTQMMEDYQFQCYRFVFNYAEGFAAAGGVLVIATTLIEGHVTSVIWMKKQSHSMKNQCLCVSLWFLIIIIAIIPFLVIIILIAVIVSTCFLKAAILGNGQSIMLFISYAVVGLFSTGVCFCMLIFSDTKPKSSASSTQSLSADLEPPEQEELESST